MPLAKGSGKTAIENQKYVGFIFKIGQTHLITEKIIQREIRGGHIYGNLWHANSSVKTIPFPSDR